MGTWTLDDIPWETFDPARVDPELLKLVKAASVVEHNGYDYARYLEGVFKDDADFGVIARQWAEEEVQHGKALARWAGLADPTYEFEACFARFTEKIKLPKGLDSSVRGSRVGELIARCMVEVGTSSYYSALGAKTDEPVLKEICRRIAADEFRHYKMFYSHMKRYLERDRIGFWRRLWVALDRIGETEDDELAYAYYATNHAGEGPYDRERFTRACIGRAYGLYQPAHLKRGVTMILKAIGIRPGDWMLSRLADAVYLFMRLRSRIMVRAGA
ncbi:MAG: acyl-ACP desaturase [Alphaproteobacteria bacterium]